MTLQEFARYAQGFGADIARWPESVRAQALHLAASAEAEAILAGQRALDTALRDGAPDVAPGRIDRVIHRVVTALAAEPPRARLAGTFARWLVPAGLACALGIGALAATIGPLADSGADDTRGVLTMIFDMTTFDQGFAL